MDVTSAVTWVCAVMAVAVVVVSSQGPNMPGGKGLCENRDQGYYYPENRRMPRWTRYGPDDAQIFTIQYTVVSFDNHQRIIERAIAEWEKYTCVRFKRVFTTRDNLLTRVAHIGFSNLVARGCGEDAPLGFRGDKQHAIRIRRGNDCLNLRTVTRAIGRVLGFENYEVAKYRKDYITIRRKNVDPNRIQCLEESDNGPAAATDRCQRYTTKCPCGGFMLINCTCMCDSGIRSRPLIPCDMSTNPPPPCPCGSHLVNGQCLKIVPCHTRCTPSIHNKVCNAHLATPATALASLDIGADATNDGLATVPYDKENIRRLFAYNMKRHRACEPSFRRTDGTCYGLLPCLHAHCDSESFQQICQQARSMPAQFTKFDARETVILSNLALHSKASSRDLVYLMVGGVATSVWEPEPTPIATTVSTPKPGDCVDVISDCSAVKMRGVLCGTEFMSQYCTATCDLCDVKYDTTQTSPRTPITVGPRYPPIIESSLNFVKLLPNGSAVVRLTWTKIDTLPLNAFYQVLVFHHTPGDAKFVKSDVHILDLTQSQYQQAFDTTLHHNVQVQAQLPEILSIKSESYIFGPVWFAHYLPRTTESTVSTTSARPTTTPTTLATTTTTTTSTTATTKSTTVVVDESLVPEVLKVDFAFMGPVRHALLLVIVSWPPIPALPHVRYFISDVATDGGVYLQHEVFGNSVDVKLQPKVEHRIKVVALSEVIGQRAKLICSPRYHLTPEVIKSATYRWPNATAFIANVFITTSTTATTTPTTATTTPTTATTNSPTTNTATTATATTTPPTTAATPSPTPSTVKVTFCIKGWTNHGGECYGVVPCIGTSCRASTHEQQCMYHGGHAATIPNADVNEALRADASLRQMHRVVIGINSEIDPATSTNRWTMARDKTRTIDYTNWQRDMGHDQAECAAMVAYGQYFTVRKLHHPNRHVTVLAGEWISGPCDDVFPKDRPVGFVCVRNPTLEGMCGVYDRVAKRWELITCDGPKKKLGYVCEDPVSKDHIAEKKIGPCLTRVEEPGSSVAKWQSVDCKSETRYDMVGYVCQMEREPLIDIVKTPANKDLCQRQTSGKRRKNIVLLRGTHKKRSPHTFPPTVYPPAARCECKNGRMTKCEYLCGDTKPPYFYEYCHLKKSKCEIDGDRSNWVHCCPKWTCDSYQIAKHEKVCLNKEEGIYFVGKCNEEDHKLYACTYKHNTESYFDTWELTRPVKTSAACASKAHKPGKPTHAFCEFTYRDERTPTTRGYGCCKTWRCDNIVKVMKNLIVAQARAVRTRIYVRRVVRFAKDSFPLANRRFEVSQTNVRLQLNITYKKCTESTYNTDPRCIDKDAVVFPSMIEPLDVTFDPLCDCDATMYPHLHNVEMILTKLSDISRVYTWYIHLLKGVERLLLMELCTGQSGEKWKPEDFWTAAVKRSCLRKVPAVVNRLPLIYVIKAIKDAERVVETISRTHPCLCKGKVNDITKQWAVDTYFRRFAYIHWAMRNVMWKLNTPEQSLAEVVHDLKANFSDELKDHELPYYMDYIDRGMGETWLRNDGRQVVTTYTLRIETHSRKRGELYTWIHSKYIASEEGGLSVKLLTSIGATDWIPLKYLKHKSQYIVEYLSHKDIIVFEFRDVYRTDYIDGFKVRFDGTNETDDLPVPKWFLKQITLSNDKWKPRRLTHCKQQRVAREKKASSSRQLACVAENNVDRYNYWWALGIHSTGGRESSSSSWREWACTKCTLPYSDKCVTNRIVFADCWRDSQCWWFTLPPCEFKEDINLLWSPIVLDKSIRKLRPRT